MKCLSGLEMKPFAALSSDFFFPVFSQHGSAAFPRGATGTKGMMEEMWGKSPKSAEFLCRSF